MKDETEAFQARINAAFDRVNPPHYKSHPSGVECITITEHMGFCLGNALKYIWRFDTTHDTTDLEKARWYISREIDRHRLREKGRSEQGATQPSNLQPEGDSSQAGPDSAWESWMTHRGAK